MWSGGQEATFIELKARLDFAPILQRPILKRPYQLHLDWSTLNIEAILTQMDDEAKEFVVVYISMSNNNAEV